VARPVMSLRVFIGSVSLRPGPTRGGAGADATLPAAPGDPRR
jgi:hypothetical protein